jgi:hypothetical protein
MRSYVRCLATVYRTEKNGREFYKEIRTTTKKKICSRSEISLYTEWSELKLYFFFAGVWPIILKPLGKHSEAPSWSSYIQSHNLIQIVPIWQLDITYQGRNLKHQNISRNMKETKRQKPGKEHKPLKKKRMPHSLCYSRWSFETQQGGAFNVLFSERNSYLCTLFLINFVH